MAKQKEITYSQLNEIKPVTDSQKVVFDSWKQGLNQFLFGCAGTGKTFVSLYLALSEVLKNDTPYDKVVMVRSLFLQERLVFCLEMKRTSCTISSPYSNMMQFMFEQPNGTFESLYNRIKHKVVLLLSTSFLRGLTLTIRLS